MKKRVAGLLMLGLLVALVAPGLFVTAQAPIEARVLVWETIQLTDDGRFMALTADGSEEVLLDFPAGVFDRQVKTCSQDIWSAGGQGVALFAGSLQGQVAIYPMAGGPAVNLGGEEVHRMACAGPATFQFSPNKQRVGYIDYYFYFVEESYPYGALRFYDPTSGSQLADFDRAVAFMMYDDGALMLRIYPDGEGYGTEGDLDWWDGTGRRTLTTLEPIYPPDTEDVDCTVKSGSVARVGDTAYVLLGQRCEQTNANSWRLVSVPMAGGAATEIASGTPAGGFFNDNFTTNLYPTKDGAGFLVTTPSGLFRNTVNLFWITPAGAITPVLAGQHVITDRFDNRLTESRNLMLAMDGSALAFVTTNANNDETLYMLDLTTPGGEPVMLKETGTGERVFQYVWAPNNTLFYAAGSIESGELSMARPGGASQRLERGRFYRLAVSFAGDKIAAAEFYDNPDRLNDDNYQLTILNTSGVSFVLRQGDDRDNEFIPLAIQ